MKKIIILIISIILLTSCGNSETKNTKIEQKEEIMKKKNNILIKNKERTLVKHKDGNIYLYENGKQIDYLTSKASFCNKNKESSSEITYKIIYLDGDYGIVSKEKWDCYFGEVDGYPINTLFGIYLKGNTDTLIKLNEYYAINEIKVKNNILSYNSHGQDGPYEIITIDLSKKLKIKNTSPIKTTIDSKYSHNNLIKKGYKLNKLGNINEYYKKINTPENLEYGKGFTTRKTIYIKGNKILDFEINNWGGQNLILNNPKNKFTIDLSEYNYPIQSIFYKSKIGSKIVVDAELNTIKITNKEEKINKVLWNR